MVVHQNNVFKLNIQDISEGAEFKNEINFLPICISPIIILHTRVQQNMMF